MKIFDKNYLITVLVSAVATLLFIHFVAQLTVVNGESMMPTFHNGEILLMEKVTQRFGELKRNDVIVLNSGLKDKPYFIKRIIGLPGETVLIDEAGTIYIDGKVYNDAYGSEAIIDPGNAVYGYTLAEDEYYFLGDNRNNSNDSRYIGPVKKQDILGRVVFSFTRFKLE